MTRSFLFAQDSGDAATTRLIASAAQLTGFMKGEPGPARPGWYQVGGDNRAMLEQLLLALQATYPEAGAAFHAVRLWTNLLWQPAYLAVISAHLHGAVPRFATLSQGRRGIYVDGFRLVPAPQQSAPLPERIVDAGQQLRALSETMLAEVNDLVRLKPVPARRLLAERMLGLMIWLAHRRPALTQAEILLFTDSWLDVLGLHDQGRLQSVEAEGRSLLIVERKGCCLDYRIYPDRLCANCPRQDLGVRLARQIGNALAEMPAP